MALKIYECSVQLEGMHTLIQDKIITKTYNYR